MKDREFLARNGITDSELQDAAIKTIPCSIDSVEEAFNDRTDVQVNSPRAIMVVQWKGMLGGLRAAQVIMGKRKGE